MSKISKTEPIWLPYVDLACVVGAGMLWYTRQFSAPWPWALVLIPWALRWRLTGRLSRRSGLEAPLLLFLLTAGIGVWAAFDRQAAGHKFWLIVGGVLLLYALVNAESLADRRAWLLSLFAAGVALLVLFTHDWAAHPAKIAVLSRLGRGLQPSPAPPTARSPHLNIAAGVLAMMLPFAALSLLRAWQDLRPAAGERTRKRWFVLGSSLLSMAAILLALLLTTSRGAWLATAAAGGLAGLWLLAGWLSRGRLDRRKWLFAGLLAVAALLALGLGGWLWWSGAVTRLPGPDPFAGREMLLRRAPLLLCDYPLSGGGLGNFQMLYSTYVLLIHVGFTTHSHNFFLNVAIEQGLVGLLALFWAWGLFALAAWRALTGEPQPGRGILAAAALSLTIMLTHGLVDNPLYSSHGLLVMFAPLAFAAPFLPKRRRSRIYLPLGLSLALVLALVWRQPILSRIYSNLGAVHQSQTELSLYSWPEWPVQDAVRRSADLSRAVAELERALAFDPRNAAAHRRLGMIALARGEYEAALAHLQAAYAGEPWSMTTRQLYGEALIVNGQVEEGHALWAGVDNAQGQLQVRAAWYRYIGDEQRAAWVQQALDGL